MAINIYFWLSFFPFYNFLLKLLFSCMCSVCICACMFTGAHTERVQKSIFFETWLLDGLGTHPVLASAILLPLTSTLWHWAPDTRGHAQPNFYMGAGPPNSVQNVVLPTEPSSANLFSCFCVASHLLVNGFSLGLLLLCLENGSR